MDHPEPAYQFDDFLVETGTRRLSHRGDAVALTSKLFDALVFLVQQRARVVDKSELINAIWADTIVEENNLNQTISRLRRVLGDTRGEPRFIVTVQGKGYRFIAPVTVLGAAAIEGSPTTTLAVLPFENLINDPEREYISDGLTEEAIASLGQIDPSQLSVIGRTSVMRYKRTTKTVAEIGAELQVGYLLEGSVRAEGSRYRITCRLLRVSDQVQQWSQSYDSEPASMLAFQRELGAAIAEQIRLTLSPGHATALARRQAHNVESYDLYLRGRHSWNQLTPPTTRRAIDYFSRATALDPHYALAWAGLADAYAASPVTGDAPPLSVWKQALDAAERAVQAEPELAEAQTSLGFVRFWLDWDWPAALAAFRKAIRLDPSYPMAHRMLGICLAHMNSPLEAREAMRRARELEPLYAMHQALSAQAAFAARDYESALQFARQSIVVDPEFWIGYLQLAQPLEQQGHGELALEALAQAARLSGGNSKVLALKGYILARHDRESEAREVLATLEAVGRERYIPPYAVALVYAGLDQAERALDWLERAHEVHDVHLMFLPVDPKWDRLRSAPRFIQLLRLCKF